MRKLEEFIKYDLTLSAFLENDIEIVIPVSVFEKWLKENDLLSYETHHVVNGQLVEHSGILKMEEYWECTEPNIIHTDLENMINELNFFN